MVIILTKNIVFEIISIFIIIIALQIAEYHKVINVVNTVKSNNVNFGNYFFGQRCSETFFLILNPTLVY